MDAGKLKGLLTHKVGPLPAVGWAALVGGSYLAYAYYKHSKQPVTTTDTGVIGTASPSDLSSALDFSNGYSDATGTGNLPVSSATNTYVPPAIADNQTWGQRAINALVARGVNPSDANAAIDSYINQTGAALNSTQSSALNDALALLGAPPVGVLTPPTTNTTPSNVVLPSDNTGALWTTSEPQPVVTLAQTTAQDTYNRTQNDVGVSDENKNAAAEALMAAGGVPM